MATTVPVGTLRRGGAGESVRQLQEALAALGYYEGAEVDGDFGPKTEAAVRAFQDAKGLDVDGVYGPASRAALEVALGLVPASAAQPAKKKGGGLGVALLVGVVLAGLALVVAGLVTSED